MNLSEPLDLTQYFQLSNFVSRHSYKINDPSANSVYNDNGFFSEENITKMLNRQLIWKTDEQGLVILDFKVYTEDQYVHYGYIRESYNPEDINTELKLLGAIHSFYNQEVTEELIDKIKQSIGLTVLQEKIKEEWENRGRTGTLYDFLGNNPVFQGLVRDFRYKYYDVLIGEED